MILGLFEEKPGPRDVVENLAEYPFKVTTLPYEMSVKQGPYIAWVDNERLLFLENFTTKEGKGRKRLVVWSEKEGRRIIREKVRALCARNGLVGYIEDKSYERGNDNRERYFGKFGEEKLLPPGKGVSHYQCKVVQVGGGKTFPSGMEIGGKLARTLDPNMYFWQPTSTSARIAGKVIVNNEVKNILPFRGLWTTTIKYMDHLNLYMVNRAINELCTESSCSWEPYNYSFFVDENGQSEAVKWDLPWLYVVEGDRPWFDVYPITKYKYLYFSSNRVRSPHPLTEFGLYMVDLKTKKTTLLLKGDPVGADISPNGCKAAVSRIVKGVNSRHKGRSVQLAVIDLCQPN